MISPDLALVHALADTADAISMRRFRALDLQVASKPDLTPVSDADLAVEDAIRAVLREQRPQDAVLGEEQGLIGGVGDSPRRWVIDPIDGTKNYIRGVPVWATLIALMLDDQVHVAMVSAPELHRRWWAQRGEGAWAGPSLADGVALQVSTVSTLADASLSYSSLSGWESRGLLLGFLELTRSCWRTRGFGDFWSHMMVAEGVVDVAAEPEVSLWDLAAVSLVVTEAGGRFSSLSGEPGPDGGSAVSSNGLLHEDVLGMLRTR